MTAVTMTPGPTLRYGMTPWRSRSGANPYDLAEVPARRVGDG
jgi:hypothetical protein